MQSHVEVTFHEIARNPSLEASVRRWAARLEDAAEIVRAKTTIERNSARRTVVSLTLSLADGEEPIIVTSHPDPYVAIADAFRAARKQLLESPAS